MAEKSRENFTRTMAKLRNKIIINAREFIFNLNNKSPLIGRPLVFGWRVLCNLKFIIRKEVLKLKTRLKYTNDKIDFNKICWVNPHKIKYSIGNFNIWRNYNKIKEGDWDLNKKEFDELDVYRAFKQVFQQGKKWEETDFYKRVLHEILYERLKWECKTKEDWDNRLKSIESLYHRIKKEGYKTQKELNKKLQSDLLDEVTVVIGRNGQLVLAQGRHRLSIAKILNIPKIPVRVIMRHKKWMEFRGRLIYFSKNYQKGKLYQPLTHPDLQDIPFRRDGERRFKIIKENLTVKNGTLFDIGANLGYFCHKFEEEGFDCYALEENQMCLYFLRELKKIENKKFKIISKNVFEYKKNQEIVFDVVLALSIFHHFLDRKDTYLNFIKFLNRLKTKEMFFESYLSSEFQNRKLYQKYTPEQFVDFIIKNSCCLNRVTLVGKSENGRPLYKLTP